MEHLRAVVLIEKWDKKLYPLTIEEVDGLGQNACLTQLKFSDGSTKDVATGFDSIGTGTHYMIAPSSFTHI